MKNILIYLINIYQKTISPDHSNIKYGFSGCRFYPSCSEYFKQALQKYGLWKGVSLGFKRILKCHPLNEGGIDQLK